MAEIKDFLSSSAQQQIEDYIKSLGVIGDRYKDLNKNAKAFEGTAKEFNDIAEKAKEVETAANSTTVATGKLSNQLASYSAIAKQSESVNKRLTNTYAKLQSQRSKEFKELTRNQLAIQRRNRLIKDEIRLEDAAGDSITAMRVELKRLNEQYDNGSEEIRKDLLPQIKELNKELLKQEEASGRSQRNVGNYGSALRGLTNPLELASGGVKGFTQNIKVLAKAGLTLLLSPLGLAVGAIAGAVALFRRAQKESIEFGKALSSLQAITGASGDELDFFRKKAKEFSSQSLTSATEFLTAFEKVGSIRPELLKNSEALAEVTNQAVILSEASGGKLPLEDAAKALTFSLNQFNLSAEESSRVANAFAAATKFGSATAQDYTDTFKNFGAVAADSNSSLEESLALTSVLAEQNIVSAEAGTKLRGVFNRLQKEGLGYASGQFQINDALREFKGRLDGAANAAERDADLLEVLGAENKNAGTILLNNIDTVESLTEAFTGTNTALEQQAIQNDNVAGAQKQLGNAWKNFLLTIDGGNGIITNITKGALRFFADRLNALSQGLVKLGAIFRTVKKLLKGDIGFKDFGESLKEEIKLTNESIATKKKQKEAEKEAAAAQEQAAKERVRLTKEEEKEKEKERKKAAAKKKKEEEAAEKEATAIVKESLALQLKEQQNKVAQELNLLKVRKEQGEITEQEYLDAVFDLRNKAVKDEIERLDLLLDETDIKESEKLKIKQKIEEQKQKLDDLSTQNVIDNLNLQKDKEKEIEDQKIKDKEDAAKERERIEKELNKELQRISQGTLTEQKNALKELLSNTELTAEQRKNVEKELSEVSKGLLAEQSDFINEFAQLSIGLVNTIYDNQIQKSEEAERVELENLQNRFDKGLISEEQYETAKVNIEKKGNEERAKIKRKQAIADKAAALIDVAINTAVAISKVLGQTGIFGLAAWIPIAALGALQAATIAAKPIPRFATGTQSSPGTFIAGERGREIVVTKSGEPMIAEQPTLFTGLQGSKVLTNRETEMLLKNAGRDAPESDDRLLKSVRELVHITKKKSSQRQDIRKTRITDRQGTRYNTYLNRLYE